MVFVGDLAEHRLRILDQIHLVHRQHHVANAEQRRDVGVPARLRQQALARIDQHHRHVGGGSAGGHVAGVLLVSGTVGDDETALVCAEVAVGHVDGDALFALGVEAIEQQRVVDLLTLRSMPLAVARERGKLVVEQVLAFVQQPADQRALAVVDAATGNEAQARLGFVLRQVADDVEWAAHQKYPSCFFFSIEADGSLSISRPWRSEVRATSISPMIFSSVSASDSNPPVRG